MNVLRKIGCRVYQGVLYVGMAFMPWREPKILDGEDSFVKTVDFMSDNGVKRPLIVCDKAALEGGQKVPATPFTTAYFLIPPSNRWSRDL